MKTTSSVTIIFFFLLCISFYSCQKEPDSGKRINKEMEKVSAVKPGDFGFRDNEFASQSVLKHIAKLSIFKDYREFVYREIVKKFDGESNCLINKLNSQYMSKSDRITNVAPAFDSIIASNNTKGFYPQIYILDYYMKKRNSSNLQDSKVYFINAINSSEKDIAFQGYQLDGNGELCETNFLIDEKFAMENEVWILSINERVSPDGVFKSNSSLKNQRVGTHSEYLMSIRCPNLNEIESWIKGAPELRIILKSAKGDITDQWFYPATRSAIDNVWWSINGSDGRYLYYWDIESYTKTVLFSWVEWDGFGDTHTYSSSFVYKDIDPVTHQEFTSTANYSYVYKSWDMLWGSITVHIDDGMMGHMYQTGLIDFQDDYR